MKANRKHRSGSGRGSFIIVFFGMFLAASSSCLLGNPIGWIIVHGLCSWTYLVYLGAMGMLPHEIWGYDNPRLRPETVEERFQRELRQGQERLQEHLRQKEKEKSVEELWQQELRAGQERLQEHLRNKEKNEKNNR